MNIALVLLSANQYGGITYARNLIPALAAADTVNTYHLFIAKNHPLIPFIRFRNFTVHECPGAGSELARFTWEQCVLPFVFLKYGIHVVYTAKNIAIYFARCKTVIALRNMEPLRYKEYNNHWTLNLRSWLKFQLTKWSFRKADAIVAVSGAVKDYLEAHFPTVRGKVVVIYNGNPVPIGRGGATSPVFVEPFLLCASKIVAYANQLNLVRAYGILHQNHPSIPPLWLIGGVHDPQYAQAIKKIISDLRLEKKIVWKGLVDQQKLFDLYRSTSLFIFPSTLESCPHTLIEAMSCGALIACSHTAPMPEICQNVAAYFNPDDPKDIASTIEGLLEEDSETAHRRREAGFQRSSAFTWANSAEQLTTVFSNVVERRRVE